MMSSDELSWGGGSAATCHVAGRGIGRRPLATRRDDVRSNFTPLYYFSSHLSPVWIDRTIAGNVQGTAAGLLDECVLDDGEGKCERFSNALENLDKLLGKRGHELGQGVVWRKKIYEIPGTVNDQENDTKKLIRFTNRSTCVDSLALTPFESVSITPRKERNERGRGGRTSSRWSGSSRFRISDTVNTRLAALTGSFSAHRRIPTQLPEFS
eukprot:scaffold3701_cov192-Alexandrium_tamarense.AAC.17